MGVLSLENIPGLSVAQFADQVTEIAITGTDISFTYVQNYAIADLKPGDYIHVWASMNDDKCSINKWLGSNETFIHHTNEFMKCVTKSGRLGDEFRMVAMYVFTVDVEANSFTAELLPHKKSPITWRVSIDENNVFDITDINK